MKKHVVILLLIAVALGVSFFIGYKRPIDVPVEFTDEEDTERIVIKDDTVTTDLTIDDIKQEEIIFTEEVEEDTEVTKDEDIDINSDEEWSEQLLLGDEDSYKSFIGWAVTGTLLEEDKVLGSDSFFESYDELLLQAPYIDIKDGSYDDDFDIDMRNKVVTVYVNGGIYKFSFTLTEEGLVDSIEYMED